MDEDRAFAVLTRASSESETELRAVADHLVRTRELLGSEAGQGERS